MSQFSIIRFGSACEIAGLNIPPPPDKPAGSQRIGSVVAATRVGDSPFMTDKSNASKPHLANEEIALRAELGRAIGEKAGTGLIEKLKV
jgi:hypothetical protein